MRMIQGEHGGLKRVVKAKARGLLNVVGLPLELVRTPVDEYKTSPWTATFTFIPRTLTNIFTRAVSAVYDLGFSPFILPFTNDMTPLTEPMGLPDYPWQVTADEF